MIPFFFNITGKALSIKNVLDETDHIEKTRAIFVATVEADGHLVVSCNILVMCCFVHIGWETSGI